MEFDLRTVKELEGLVEWESYIGGSTLVTFSDFYSYVTTKRLIDDSRATDEFRWCGYAPVRNVMRSEDTLLDVRETAWNRHRVSNCGAVGGWVYVLLRRKPWTTTGKVAVAGGILAAILGGTLLYLNSKPPVAPPPPAPPIG